MLNPAHSVGVTEVFELLHYLLCLDLSETTGFCLFLIAVWMCGSLFRLHEVLLGLHAVVFWCLFLRFTLDLDVLFLCNHYTIALGLLWLFRHFLDDVQVWSVWLLLLGLNFSLNHWPWGILWLVGLLGCLLGLIILLSVGRMFLCVSAIVASLHAQLDTVSHLKKHQDQVQKDVSKNDYHENVAKIEESLGLSDDVRKAPQEVC